MNKLVIAVFLATVIASSLAASLNDAQLLREENENDGYGNYRFFFEQSDETRHEQKGTLRNPGTDNEFIAVEGFYTWRSPDGELYLVEYTADDNGYKPKVSKGPGALPPAATASLLG